MASWSNLNLQNSSSPLMENLLYFHDSTMMIIILISIFILYMISSNLTNKFYNFNLLEHQNIEFIWTIIPSIFLLMIAFPSLHLLYLMDEVNKPNLSLKIIGHQWYWSYEYSDFKNIKFDSYMTPLSLETPFRLLDVDNRIILPFNLQIRSLVTSSDTIHAWTIPAIGMKTDAMPGRLNQISFLINRPGLFYGQCSEICGANHSFMPICIESINLNFFFKWIKSFN
uniref:cytochrome c oxidase subunit II n=1 Tax=Cheumatopsyche brevilineata TaxID=1437087 RepID=UPI0022383C65|nr:cytochrome c oxidase subunit II [Cheumatopsyche brevilineata]UYO79203.1 cytochrome c oxidase subunit II [Cheumatopsyche brevilineata]